MNNNIVLWLPPQLTTTNIQRDYTSIAFSEAEELQDKVKIVSFHFHVYMYEAWTCVDVLKNVHHFPLVRHGINSLFSFKSEI